MPAEDKAFGDIWYGEELTRFFSGFVASDRAPELRGKSVDDVLGDVKDIWREKGFLTPAELKNELIHKNMPDGPPAVLNMVAEIERSRDKPEPTTGLLNKEHAYLLKALAHLYARETGAIVPHASGDFRGMKSTNNHFVDRLAAESGVQPGRINVKSAEALTDAGMCLLCEAATESLAAGVPGAERVLGVRSGGDEPDFFVFISPEKAREMGGVFDPQRLKNLSDDTHVELEMHVAAMGLQNHPHTKHPDRRLCDGFGLALAVHDMGQVKNVDTLSQQLDAQIDMIKENLGFMRIFGTHADTAEYQKKQADFIENLCLEAESRIDLGLISGASPNMPEADRMGVIDAYVDRSLRFVGIAANAMREVNPMQNPGADTSTRAYTSYVGRELAELREKKKLREKETPGARPGPVPLLFTAAEIMSGDMRPEGVEPMATIDERRKALAKNFLRDTRGIHLTQTQEYLLDMSVEGLCPRDPSARTIMPQDMILAVEAWVQETGEFRAGFDGNDPGARAALARAGLESLDDVMPRMMAVSCHTLGGFNQALGHGNADIVLRHISDDIIGKSLREAGLPEGKGIIAHHGGLNFTALVSPGGVDEEGRPWFSSPSMMRAAELGIQKGMEDLRNTPVIDFLQEKGVEITQGMRDEFARLRIVTFADIPDATPRQVDIGGHEHAGIVNGVYAVSVTRDVEAAGEFNGGRFVEALRKTADRKMDMQRGEVLEKQYMLSDEVRGEVKSRLPSSSSPDMPPEVQALAEFNRPGMEQRFEEQYESIINLGSGAEIRDYIVRGARGAAAQATSAPAPAVSSSRPPAPGAGVPKAGG